MREPLLIRVDWNDEAHAWTADSDDVPRLATEANTVEALNQELQEMIPELLSLNGAPVSGDITYELLIRRFDSIRTDAA